MAGFRSRATVPAGGRGGRAATVTRPPVVLSELCSGFGRVVVAFLKALARKATRWSGSAVGLRSAPPVVEEVAQRPSRDPWPCFRNCSRGLGCVAGRVPKGQQRDVDEVVGFRGRATVPSDDGRPAITEPSNRVSPVHRRGRIQAVVATPGGLDSPDSSALRASAGVRQSRVFRGRLLSSAAIWSSIPGP